MDVDHGYHGERVRFYDEQMADAGRHDAGFYADRARAADGPASSRSASAICSS